MSHSEITLREITRMFSGAAHSHEIMVCSDSRLPRDYRCVGGDARDLALEILRTHTRDCKRCHLALARSGHGYRLIGQLCAGCIMHMRLGWLVLTAAPVRATAPVRVLGAGRRVAPCRSLARLLHPASRRHNARELLQPTRPAAGACASSARDGASARATWEKRAPLRWKPAQRSSDARVSGSARASAASKISPPSVVTAWLRAPSEATSCGDCYRW